MRPFAQTALRPLALAALLSLGTLPTAAQNEAAEAPAADAEAQSSSDLDLQMGEPVDEEGNTLGEEYILEVQGDWTIVCIRTVLPDDPCSMRQLLRDPDGAAISTVDIVSLPPGSQAIAAGRIITPLETLLTQQVTLAVDGGAGKRYPFEYCNQLGCISRVGFTEGDVNAFRRGAQATMTIVPALARDQRVQATMSLSGFTAGFNRVKELNEANARAIEAAQAAEGGN